MTRISRSTLSRSWFHTVSFVVRASPGCRLRVQAEGLAVIEAPSLHRSLHLFVCVSITNVCAPRKSRFCARSCDQGILKDVSLDLSMTLLNVAASKLLWCKSAVRNKCQQGPVMGQHLPCRQALAAQIL